MTLLRNTSLLTIGALSLTLLTGYATNEIEFKQAKQDAAITQGLMEAVLQKEQKIALVARQEKIREEMQAKIAEARDTTRIKVEEANSLLSIVGTNVIDVTTVNNLVTTVSDVNASYGGYSITDTAINNQLIIEQMSAVQASHDAWNVEQARIAEEARLAEEARKAAIAAEEARKAEENRKATITKPKVATPKASNSARAANPSAPASVVEPPAPSAGVADGVSEYSVAEIASAINAYRESNGLGALSSSRSGNLMKHSSDMAVAGDIWHSGSDNIVGFVKPVSSGQMISAYAASPPHNAWLLKDGVSHMSIGAVTYNGRLYTAVKFS